MRQRILEEEFTSGNFIVRAENLSAELAWKSLACLGSKH